MMDGGLMRTILCLGQVPGRPRLREDRYLILGVMAIAVTMAVVVLIVVALFSSHRDDVIIDGYLDVQFSSPEQVSSTKWKMTVAGASRAERLHDFKAMLFENGSVLEAMDPITEDPSAPFAFVDLDGDRRVGTGDYFQVECSPSRFYSISMIWRDTGNVVGMVEWQT